MHTRRHTSCEIELFGKTYPGFLQAGYPLQHWNNKVKAIKGINTAHCLINENNCFKVIL